MSCTPGFEDGLGDDDSLEPLPQGDSLGGQAQNCVPKFLMLSHQGLRLGNCKSNHVAFSHSSEMRDLGPLVGLGAIPVKRQVACQGVRDKCSVLPGHDG